MVVGGKRKVKRQPGQLEREQMKKKEGGGEVWLYLQMSGCNVKKKIKNPCLAHFLPIPVKSLLPIAFQ